MKRICLLAMVAMSAAFAKQSCQSQPQNAQATWDSDLFRQDAQVVSGHVEFLYWKTLEGALSYAVKMNGPASNLGVSYPIGNYKNAQFDIDPGFRVGVSFFRAPKYWEVWGMYTRMTSRGTNQAGPKSSSEFLFLDSTWPTQLTTLAHAKSSIHLNYNVADFLTDRYFNPNQHLRLRVLGGITGTWMSQDWSVHYLDINGHKSHVRNQWKFGGCGARIGVFADWFWTSDIYLTFRNTLAALVGPYKNRAFQTTTAPGFDPDLPLRNATYRDTRAAFHLQFILGPSWQRNWCNSARSELFVGYELNLWQNVQEIYHSTGGNAVINPKEPWINTGTLVLQGLTTRVSVDY